MYEIKTILQEKAIFKEIEYLREERRKVLLQRDCKIRLANFSILYIKETWKGEELLKYSCYWFTSNNKLISGWDNAPHHKEIKSFPHHRHSIDGVEPSVERDLFDIIEYIENKFTGE